MKKFHYFDSNEVILGDIVRGPRGRLGRVERIIQPGGTESISFDCPEGGVLFMFAANGVESPLLMPPPDGLYWEDIEFLGRSK